MAFLDTTDKTKPAYMHQEYPKHINFTDGKFLQVNDAAEEALVIEENGHRLPKLVIGGVEPANESDALRKAKASLVSVAEKLGIEIDKRWSLEKIDAAINAAMNENRDAVVEED